MTVSWSEDCVASSMTQTESWVRNLCSGMLVCHSLYSMLSASTAHETAYCCCHNQLRSCQWLFGRSAALGSVVKQPLATEPHSSDTSLFGALVTEAGCNSYTFTGVFMNKSVISLLVQTCLTLPIKVLIHSRKVCLLLPALRRFVVSYTVQAHSQLSCLWWPPCCM